MIQHIVELAGWALPTMPVLSLSKRSGRFDMLRTDRARPTFLFRFADPE